MPQEMSSSSSWMVIVFDPKDPIVPYLGNGNHNNSSSSSSNNNNNNTSTSTMRHEVVSLKHPGTGDESDFLLVTIATKSTSTTDEINSNIYQLEALNPTATAGNKYGSFMIGSRVVRNGTLHVATRMDPLFFVLDALSPVSTGTHNSPTDHDTITATTSRSTSTPISNQKHQTKWQPLEQLDIPKIIQKCIRNPKSYQHICLTNDQLGNDMLLYKINDEKILSWLLQKQQRICQTLKQQCLEKKNSNANPYHNNNTTHARFNGQSAGFHLVEDEPTNTTTTSTSVDKINHNCDEKLTTIATTPPTTPPPTLSSQDVFSTLEETQFKYASIQLVCEYLNSVWQTKLLHHFNLPSTMLYQTSSLDDNHHHEASNKKRTWDAVHNHHQMDQTDATVMMISVEKKSKTATAQSNGLKKLQKVSTKGMKSLSSFFGTSKTTTITKVQVDSSKK